MKKKRRPGFQYDNRFRFETPLPADLAMERLHALATHETSYYKAVETYQVSSQQQDDSIYFEIRVRTSYNWWPSLLRRVINGQIRVVDWTRTLVQGELRTPRRARALGISLLILLAGAVLLSLSTGKLPPEDFAKAIGLVIFCTIVFLLNEFWRPSPHASIQRVEEFIRPRTEDQRLIAQRKERHLSRTPIEYGQPNEPDCAAPEDGIT